jgi:hypothetical protein
MENGTEWYARKYIEIEAHTGAGVSMPYWNEN